MVGRQALALLVGVRILLSQIVRDKTPSHCFRKACAAIVARLSPHRDRVHKLTYDNGKELTEHEQITPRRWERGSTLPIRPVRTEIGSHYPLETIRSQSIDLTCKVNTPSKWSNR